MEVIGSVPLEPQPGYTPYGDWNAPKLLAIEGDYVQLVGVLRRDPDTPADNPAVILPAAFRPPMLLLIPGNSRPPYFEGEWDHRKDHLMKISPAGEVWSTCEAEPEVAYLSGVFSIH